MKNKYIDYNPVKGFITFNDLIGDLKEILHNYKDLEDIVINILKNLQVDNETITSLFVCNIANNLEDIINVLQRL